MSDQVPPIHVQVTPPEPSFQIGLREVYDTMNTKLDTLTSKVDGLSSLPEEVRDHEKRLRDLEAHYVSKASARWWFTSVVALLVAATGIIALVIQR